MMKKEKTYALLCYAAALCLYVVAAINFLGGENKSTGITWLCFGSAMFCYGGVLLHKSNEKDEDKDN